jgi:hypothetical protein
MSLSESSLTAPAPRRHLHTRTIACEGFLRDDGLWDIEARIIDTKTYAYSEVERGARPIGSHVHDMWVRLTLDTSMVVRNIETSMLSNPYEFCLSAQPAYKKLIGAKVGSGWRKAVNEAVGGDKGCTHVRELLFPMATVAFQTISGWREDSTNANTDTSTATSRDGSTEGSMKADTQINSPPLNAKGLPYFVGGCKAWAADSPVTRREYPQFFIKAQT